jgi:hypothetical protein
MWPLGIVVVDVDSEHGLQMPLIQNEKPVQALGPHRPDPPFRVRIRAGRLHRRADYRAGRATEDLIKGQRELAVPITHEEPAATVELWALEDEISGLLRDPGGVLLRGAAADVYPPVAQLDEEQHVQRLQPHRLDCKEVTREDAGGLLTEEHPPADSTPARGRPEPVTAQECPDRGGRHSRSREAAASRPTLWPARPSKADQFGVVGAGSPFACRRRAAAARPGSRGRAGGGRRRGRAVPETGGAGA